MKRSDFYIKLLTGALFFAVMSYIGVYVYNAAKNNMVTMTAISYALEETAHAEGYFVRNETVVAGGTAALPIIGDGVKVAAGQAVAMDFRSGSAIEAASEIRELRLKITQLEAASGNSDITALSYESVLELSRAVTGGRLAAIDELSLKIENYIFSGGLMPADELPSLKARLNTLEQHSSGSNTIYAPISGVFSSEIDGFEHINPDMLKALTPSSLTALFNDAGTQNGAGKLISGIRWYYAAIMDTADAAKLSDSKEFQLQFTGTFRMAVNMRVEDVGKAENEQCVVIFSSNRNIPEAAPFRNMQAEVIFGTVTGIRVPKEAIRLDDNGGTFVYVLSGVLREKANVEILLESGDSYLVKDGSGTNSGLRPGAAIVVKANDLSNSKVIG